MLTEVSRVDRSQVRGEKQEEVVTGHRTPLEVRRHNEIMGERSEREEVQGHRNMADIMASENGASLPRPLLTLHFYFLII